MRAITQLTKALFAKAGEAFVMVSLPHTWNNLDGQDGGDDYWRGMGVYHIVLPDPTPGKRQYIELRGANHVATVYCNGRLLGTHKGGFSTFRFDLTEAMKPKDNTLTVSVTNAPSAIYPQMADFTFYGGLYRDVRYIEVDEAHFDLLKDGTEAVFVTPRTPGFTRVDLFPVRCDGCQVRVQLKDAQGAVVAEGTAEAAAHTIVKLRVDHPHLWQGVEDPYCYTCEATLLRGEEALDCIQVRYGYRTFHVDPARGFFLNGQSTPLRGVCRHQDRENMGWAISRREHDEDMALIREVGANTIRLAHYQQDQYFYDLCDQYGLVVWAEIPFISRFDPSDEARENTLSQMRELIAQSYNHPSICFWGIANEITLRCEESEALYDNLSQVAALVKRLDPSRLTTMAQLSNVPIDGDHAYITDVVSYNHYMGWYGGDVSMNGPWMDRFHEANPDRALGISEYGADAVLSWHTVAPENHDYTEEYQAYYHHEMLKAITARPFLWATHLWNMFDFAADARNEGGSQGRNNKGLVTYDRKTKKEAFFIYQAYWSKTPMVHVCGERFTDRAPGERQVIVYTNQPEVTLFVNSQPIGTRKAVDHSAVFEEVPLKDGSNSVWAKAGEVCSNTVQLRAVAEHNFAYDLPEGNDAGNWFNDPEARKPLSFPDGYYNVTDQVTDLYACPAAAEVLERELRPLLNNFMAKAALDAAKDPQHPMAGAMGAMKLSGLLRIAARDIPAGTKRKLNELLTQIPRQ